jgi:hypothetical protein
MIHKNIPVLLILVAVTAPARAEIAPESTQQLEAKSTHIVEGTADVHRHRARESWRLA